jgi:hypothetical protein
LTAIKPSLDQSSKLRAHRRPLRIFDGNKVMRHPKEPDAADITILSISCETADTARMNPPRRPIRPVQKKHKGDSALARSRGGAERAAKRTIATSISHVQLIPQLRSCPSEDAVVRFGADMWDTSDESEGSTAEIGL